jgi:hypothetical protein
MVDMDSDAAAIESRYTEQTTNKNPTTQAEKPVQLAELTAPEETPKAAKAASRNGKKKASKPSTTAGPEIDESEEKTAADAVSAASDE